MKFIGNPKLMATSLPNLIDTPTEGINKIKCEDCDCFLEYESAKESSIKFKCVSYNKDYSNIIAEELKNKIQGRILILLIMILINLCCFSEQVFILMSIWINGKSLMKHHYLKKKIFYSKLDMEDFRPLIINHSFIITRPHREFFLNNTTFCLIMCHH